jgi:FG-GAP-like repeat/Secretion system C-terminal sorting domain
MKSQNFYLRLFSASIIAVFFLNTSIFAQSDFKKNEITDQFTKGYDIFPKDIDGDGHLDFVAVAKYGNGEVAWWRNDGMQRFEKHSIRQDFVGVRSVRAGDINGDGHVDVIAAAWESNEILWWQNDGNENWTEHAVDTNFLGAHTVELKDLNKDGHIDVLCSGFNNTTTYSEIAWWKNDGNEVFTKHMISDRFQQSPFIYPEDMDGDGDLDVIACGELNNEVLWWENDGDEIFTEHMIDSELTAAHTVLARDIDQDGDYDILAAACMSATLCWYENKAFNDFEKHDLGYLPGALWLDAADFDLDGDVDLVAGGMGYSKLAVFYNDGTNDFTRIYTDDSFSSAFCTRPVDLDKDSDMDILAIGYNSNEISWFSNQAINPDYIQAPESVAYDHERQRYLVSAYNANAIVAIDKFTHEQELFVENIDGPLGNCIYDGVFYVSTQDKLKGFDLVTGDETLSITIPCIQHLDGMTTDNAGNLYVLDTGGKLYKINLSTQNVECIVESGFTPAIQDCVFDPANNRLIAVGWSASSPIQAIDLGSNVLSDLTTFSIGYFDGVAIDPEGCVYVASHISNGKIAKYQADFSDYEIISSGHDDPAGLDYNAYDDMLVVPNFGGNSLDYIDLGSVGIENKTNDSGSLFVYPNPNDGRFSLKFNSAAPQTREVAVFDLGGKMVFRLNTKDARPSFDLSHLVHGSYFLSVREGDETECAKLLIR